MLYEFVLYFSFKFNVICFLLNIFTYICFFFYDYNLLLVYFFPSRLPFFLLSSFFSISPSFCPVSLSPSLPQHPLTLGRCVTVLEPCAECLSSACSAVVSASPCPLLSDMWQGQM